MKIALIGTAPSSVRLAPYSDPSWQIWACSPGTYPIIPRAEAFFELHRWEPGVIGKPDTQKPWFSPEYCAWLAKQQLVWMANAVPEVPNSRALPWQRLVEKYGSYFFTSSLSWMFAMAIEAIQEHRAKGHNEPCSIGLWGVDMAANEEYGYQRAGCQFFAMIAQQLNIQVIVPPESDLLMPPPLYGISESDYRMIKASKRRDELVQHMQAMTAQRDQLALQVKFLEGAIDDMTYNINTWMQEGPIFGTNFGDIFNLPAAPAPAEPKLKIVGDQGTE